MAERKYKVFLLNRTKTRKYEFVYCSYCGYIIDSFEKRVKKGDKNCCNCGSTIDWSEIKNYELKEVK